MSDPALNMETLVNFDASTLNGTFQVINGTGTEEPCIAFKFYNSSASLVLISYDGVNPHDFVPPGGTFIFDSQTNATPDASRPGLKLLREGQRVWAATSSNTDRLIMAGYRE